jgi:hypothetical protein
MWALLGGLWPKLLAGGAALAAAIGGLAMVRRDGVRAQQNADFRQKERDRDKSEKVAAADARLDDSSVDRELHQQYDRK